MIRKHFRLKRIALGLAFAAIAAPVAQATPYGGSPASQQDESVLSTVVSPYELRSTHIVPGGMTVESTSIVRSENTSRRPIASEISVQSTLSQAQVEALRYQAMVDLYSRQSPVRSENSFGAPGPSLAGATGPQHVISTVSSSRFDWTDAGLGAGAVFATMLVLMTAVGLGRRNRSRLAGA